MADRKPELLNAESVRYDQHHGISFKIVYRGLNNEPIDTITLSQYEAMQLAERLTRCVRQSMTS